MADCEVAEVLEQHLRMRALIGADMPLARLCLGIGVSRQGRPWPKARMTPKACYRNAFYLAESTGFSYAEGFALSAALIESGIHLPVEHAWCVDADGFAVDPTWPDPAGSFYLGVEFSLSQIRNRMKETGVFGMFSSADHYGPDNAFMEGLMPGLAPGVVDPRYLPDIVEDAPFRVI